MITESLPLLSIIIPTLNSELTIDQCLMSIRRQVFRDFEIIIVDGGSHDDTVNLAKRFAEGNTIKIISGKDQGTYDAMNKGIAISKGKWLYFLGSDDWLYDENILFSIFSNRDYMQYDVLYGNVYRPGLQAIYDGEFSKKKLLQKNLCHQAVFYKRMIFEVTGLFNMKYKVLSDWDHNLKWFYNPAILKKFVGLTVANYSDDGLSGKNEDDIFQADKFLNVYDYAYRHLDRGMKWAVLKLIIYSFVVRKKYLHACKFLLSMVYKPSLKGK